MGDHSIEPWANGSVPTKESEEEWGASSSPLSYTGATRRMITWADRSVQGHPGRPTRTVIVWTTAVTGMMALYAIATAWYLLLAFNLLLALMVFAFTVIVWPLLPLGMAWLLFSLAPFGFRSHRKSQRQQTAMMAQQLKAMEAIQANTAAEQRRRNE